MRKVRLPALLALVLVCTLSGPATAQNQTVEEDLRRQLRDRDAEISALRQQLENLRSHQLAAPPGNSTSSSTSSPLAGPTTAPGSSAVPSATDAAKEDDLLATALESALVRQGGAVLSPGTIELEPELSYFYDDVNGRGRRDTFGTALSARFGLASAMQADVYVPYVIRDRETGGGSGSGIGDVHLGLTKELRKEQEGMPSVLIFGRWRTTTGDINRNPPTGFGQHGLQLGMSATKRMDPALLFGSLSYTTNLGTARLQNGMRFDSGNTFGLRLGAYLAATPSTSFYWGVAYNTSTADRFNGERIELTDRASGFLELGSTTVIGRGQFVNLGIGIGVTSAAPKFSLTASLPFRF